MTPFVATTGNEVEVAPATKWNRFTVLCRTIQYRITAPFGAFFKYTIAGYIDFSDFLI